MEYVENDRAYILVEEEDEQWEARKDMIKVQRWPNIHDAAEKRAGHWFDKGSLSCRCSECGCKSNKESNYCPNCGAKMEQGEQK